MEEPAEDEPHDSWPAAIAIVVACLAFGSLIAWVAERMVSR